MNRVELFNILAEQGELEEKLARMDGAAIAHLITEYVWSEIDVTTPQSVLLSVAVEKLKAAQLPGETDPPSARGNAAALQAIVRATLELEGMLSSEAEYRAVCDHLQEIQDALQESAGRLP